MTTTTKNDEYTTTEIAFVYGSRAEAESVHANDYEAVTRIELVVTFLALLELIRLRRVRVAQERNFGEIRVYPYRTDSQE